MQVHKNDSTLRTIGFSRSRSPTVQELNMSCLVYVYIVRQMLLKQRDARRTLGTWMRCMSKAKEKGV